MSENEITVAVGSEWQVTLTKDYGPMVFSDLRITVSVKRGVWVIERECRANEWVEWVAIPAQLPIDEECEHYWDTLAQSSDNP